MINVELKDSEQLIDIMNKVIIPESSIGTHSILSVHGGNIGKFDLEKEERAKSILKTGLYTSPYARSLGLISTIYFHGKKSDEVIEKVFNYFYLLETEVYKVVIALPPTVFIDDKEYIIDEFPASEKLGMSIKSDEYEELARKNKFNEAPLVPSEFIVGYIVDETVDREKLKEGDKLYNKHTLYLNESYYGLTSVLSEESKNIIRKYATTQDEKAALLRGIEKQNRLMEKR